MSRGIDWSAWADDWDAKHDRALNAYYHERAWNRRKKYNRIDSEETS